MNSEIRINKIKIGNTSYDIKDMTEGGYLPLGGGIINGDLIVKDKDSDKEFLRTDTDNNVVSFGDKDDFHILINEDGIGFYSNNDENDDIAKIETDKNGDSILSISKGQIKDYLHFHCWEWKERENHNLTLKYIGGESE